MCKSSLIFQPLGKSENMYMTSRMMLIVEQVQYTSCQGERKRYWKLGIELHTNQGQKYG